MTKIISRLVVPASLLFTPFFGFSQNACHGQGCGLRGADRINEFLIEEFLDNIKWTDLYLDYLFARNPHLAGVYLEDFFFRNPHLIEEFLNIFEGMYLEDLNPTNPHFAEDLKDLLLRNPRFVEDLKMENHAFGMMEPPTEPRFGGESPLVRLEPTKPLGEEAPFIREPTNPPFGGESPLVRVEPEPQSRRMVPPEDFIRYLEKPLKKPIRRAEPLEPPIRWERLPEMPIRRVVRPEDLIRKER